MWQITFPKWWVFPSNLFLCCLFLAAEQPENSEKGGMGGFLLKVAPKKLAFLPAGAKYRRRIEVLKAAGQETPTVTLTESLTASMNLLTGK